MLLPAGGEKEMPETSDFIIGTRDGAITHKGGWKNYKDLVKTMQNFVVHMDLRNNSEKMGKESESDIKSWRHHFYIRYFSRLEELGILLNQLNAIGIKEEQITCLTTTDEGSDDLIKSIRETNPIRLENSGYVQGDADLLDKSFEISNPNVINHYMNAGMVIYDLFRFKHYLWNTEHSDDVIHISRGNDLIENSDNNNLGSTHQNELATGMIISATKDGVGILKNCYYDNYHFIRYKEQVGEPIHISALNEYITENGRGNPVIKHSAESPYLRKEDYDRGMEAMSIEYYFYKKVWEQTNFKGVNFTDDYRGAYFLDDKEKTTHDWLLNRDAGVIRLNKYLDDDIKNKMEDIIAEYKFREKIGLHRRSIMKKSKCKGLLIVSHMDDESIFFGGYLSQFSEETKVIVTCEPSTNQEKEDSFKKVMEYCKVPEYEMWDWKESLNGYEDFENLKNKIKTEIETNEYEEVVTHNSMGEYAHIQHQQLNEIISECLYENIIDSFYVYDLNPLSLRDRGIDSEKKEDMMNLYPEQEINNTISIMRRAGSGWYDHCKPAKYTSQFVGGGNLIDFEGLKKIERLSQQKINIGLVREEPGLNRDYTDKFTGRDVKSTDEEYKLEDVYSSPTNDFLKTLEKYFDNHNVSWVDKLDEFDDFVGLTDERKDIYMAVSVESALLLHKLGLPYMFFSNFTDDVPLEIKSSALRIVYTSNSFNPTQFTETVVDYTRNHHVIRYDLHGQLWRAWYIKKRHNMVSKEKHFEHFQIEDDSNEETKGRLHITLKNPEDDGFYFVEGMDGQTGDVVVNWKVNLSTSNGIWINAGLTRDVEERPLMLRFWKDPVSTDDVPGLHIEPHSHDMLPDWKVKKVKYPDFSFMIPIRYHFKPWR